MQNSRTFAHTGKCFYNEITLLKAIAALFITWFHFKMFVPNSLQSIFIGGAIGNSIFFFCSGYLLSFKEEKYPGQWLLKKYIRIMSAVWATLCIQTICTFLRFAIFDCQALREWLFPSQFWFVRAILIYFFISYLAFAAFSRFHRKELKLGKEYLLFLILSALTIHIVYYLCFVRKDSIIMDDNGVYCWFYWYALFLLGYYVKNYTNGGGKLNKYTILECAFSIVVFFLYKRIAPHFNFLIYLQFILIPLLLLYIVYSFRKFSIYILSRNVQTRVKDKLILLSNITLEVYLVQYYFIKWIMPLLTFPINMAVTLMTVFVLAYYTHLFAEKIGSIRNYL